MKCPVIDGVLAGASLVAKLEARRVPSRRPGVARGVGVREPSTHAPTLKNLLKDMKSGSRSLPQGDTEPEPYQPSHDEQRNKQKRPLLVGLRQHRIYCKDFKGPEPLKPP